MAAAADKAGLSLSDGEEGSDEDDDGGAFSGDETEEEEEEGESDVDDLGEEEEDALSGWLAAAGVQLASGEAPPRIADPSLVRRALGTTLAHQPGAVPMFVASLRMYMDTLAKVGRVGGAGWGQGADAECTARQGCNECLPYSGAPASVFWVSFGFEVVLGMYWAKQWLS